MLDERDQPGMECLLAQVYTGRAQTLPAIAHLLLPLIAFEVPQSIKQLRERTSESEVIRSCIMI